MGIISDNLCHILLVEASHKFCPHSWEALTQRYEQQEWGGHGGEATLESAIAVYKIAHIL